MPYKDLEDRSFWRLCREAPDFLSSEIYQPKIPVTLDSRIATAGSCFAQHVGRYLGEAGVNILQAEPAPSGMRPATAKSFGYNVYSGRYGNIYTTRQLRQLIEDATHETLHDDAVWEKDGRYYDALRPSVEPKGLASEEDVGIARLDHLRRLRRMWAGTDIFVFTLGLTEFWEDRASGRAYPTCPGVIAGTFDPERHGFVNATYPEVRADLEAAMALLRQINPAIRFLFTVSPVPLTATATGGHVLPASTYSKATLRAVAGDVVADHENADYFPSFELITGAPYKSQFYAPNGRDVRNAGVAFAMGTFFHAHPALRALAEGTSPVETPPQETHDDVDDLICEEALLEAFAAQ